MIEKYNCFISVVEGNFFLFNPYSLATAIISNPDELSEGDILTAITEVQLRNLFEDNVFILESSDATSMSRYYSDKIKYRSCLTISDAMTFACNMNCIYCFENITKTNSQKLPIEDRIDLISQLIELYLSDIDRIDFVFFGGEPLLDLNYVNSMCEYISNRYPYLTIDYSFTSNGTLINDSFIALCKKYSFKEIRVTIDGTPQVHNSRRVMKNGRNSYDLIIENIEKLCLYTDIRIIINTVLDNDNSECYLSMFTNLTERLGKYIGGDRPRIIFNIGTLCHPLFDTNHTKDKGVAGSVGNQNYYILSGQLIDLGATITSPFYSPHCMNSAEKTFSIAPTGDIYKCVTGIGSKRFLLSTYEECIHNPTTLLKNNILQIEQSHRPQCLTCKYLTMCNGGCKCQYYENGDILCRKDLFEKEIEDFMRLLAKGCFTEDGLFRKRRRGDGL